MPTEFSASARPDEKQNRKKKSIATRTVEALAFIIFSNLFITFYDLDPKAARGAPQRDVFLRVFACRRWCTPTIASLQGREVQTAYAV